MLQQDDNYYMDLALKEARQAYELGEIPIGAIIVDEKGEIVSTGHNLRETKHDATAHAEIIAIRSACAKLKSWRLSGLTLYVTIEPCPMCAGALVMARLQRLVYGSSDAKAGAAESLFNITHNAALNHQLEVTAGIRADECSAIMKKFFAAKRRKKI